ncbi:MAG: MATE family efflux transporter [Pseudohaliea sp.]
MAKLYYLVIRVAYIVALVTVIGVDAYGYLAYAQNWYLLLVPLATWGTNELVISRLVALPPSERGQLLATGLALRLALGVACSLAMVIAALCLESSPRLTLLMLLYAPGVLIRSLTSGLSAVFIAHGRSSYWMRISSVFITLEVALVLALAASGADLAVLAVCQCVVWLCSLSVAGLTLRASLPVALGHVRMAVLRNLVIDGATIGAATFLLFLMQPGLLIVYRYLGSDLQSIGTVALVLQIFQVLGQILLIVSNAALPALNPAVGGNERRIQAFCGLVVSGALLIGGATAVVLNYTLPYLLSWFPATQFHPAGLQLASTSWVLVPLLALHGLRLAQVSQRKLRGFLVAAAGGFLATLLFIAAVHYRSGLTPGSLFFAMGAGMATTAALQGLNLKSLAALRDLLPTLPLLLVVAVLPGLCQGYAAVVASLAGAALLLALAYRRFHLQVRVRKVARDVVW